MTKDAVIDVVHKTIYGFFDVVADDLEEPISERDKLLLEVNKAVCNALKEMPDDERKTGWIPVTERLPELNKEVLIQYKDKKDEMKADNMFYAVANRRIEHNFHFEDWSRFTEYQGYYEVVAWMELPKPYDG